MTSDLEIRVEVTHPTWNHNVNRIVGYVGTTEVIAVSNQIAATVYGDKALCAKCNPGTLGGFTVNGSCCLPSDIKRAAAFVECMRQVFDRLAQLTGSCSP